MQLRYPDSIALIGNDNLPLSTDAAKLDCLIAENALTVKVTAPATPLCYIKLCWSLTDAEVRRENDIKVLGDAFERGYGDLEWLPIQSKRHMPWYFMVSNGSDTVRDMTHRRTECFGVKTRPAAFCLWRYAKDEVELVLDIRNGGRGVVLGERTLTVAEILFADYENIAAYDAACRFARLMCPSPRLPDAPVFGFNDWYFAYGANDKDLIYRSAQMLAKRCADYESKPYIVIDDGWQIHPTDGPWNIPSEKFGDMAELARRISDLGVLPGIWMRPLSQSAPNPSIPKEWFAAFKTDALDPSHPDVLEYVKTCVRYLTGWGYKLIKFDFITFDIFAKWAFDFNGFPAEDGWGFHDASKTTAEIIVSLYEAIREAAGDTILIGCNAVSHLCAGLVELNRTGDDTSGKEWARTLKMGVNTLAFRSPQNRAFYMADADCVGITDMIPFSLNEKWLFALSASNSPLFVSISPDTKDETVTEAVYRALVRNSKQADTLIPLDWMETKTPSRWLLNGEEINIDWNEG